MLEAPVEGAWAPAAEQYYFDDYVNRGFTAVRIPVRWDNHTARAPPYAIDPTFLARVQQVVGWSLSRNLTTIVNAHHDDWVNSEANFEAMLPRYLAIWAQVAATFASAPITLRFETLNEPSELLRSPRRHRARQPAPRKLRPNTQPGNTPQTQPANLTIAQLNEMHAKVLPVMRAGGGNNPTREVYLVGLSWDGADWLLAHPDAVVRFSPLC